MVFINARIETVNISIATQTEMKANAHEVLNDHLHQRLLRHLHRVPEQAQALPRQRIIHQDRAERLPDHADAGARYEGERD